MQYLVGQMLACLLGAGVLGLVIGWIWWGMQLRQARERAADFEQRAAKLSGYPARLMGLEATHAAFVASKNEEDAKCKGRIAELEPVAAKVPELERSLTAKTAEWEGLRTQIEGKTSELAALQAKYDDLAIQHKAVASVAEQVPALSARLETSTDWVGQLEAAVKVKDAAIAGHVQAHADKDARLVSLGKRVAELEPVAQKVPQLESQIAQHVDAQRETEEHMDQLVGQVKQHEAAHADKDARLAELLPLAALVPALKAELEKKSNQVADLHARVEQHEAAHAEKDSQISALTAHVEGHVSTLVEQDARIADLAAQVQKQQAAHAELAPLAALVPQLQAQVEEHAGALAEKDAHIAELTAQLEQQPVVAAAHSETDEHIAELVAAAALVPVLKSELAAKDNHVADLKAQVERHAAAHAEKDTHIGALLSRVEELQPMAAGSSDLQSKLESVEYEHNLTARKLRMAEAATAAHQVEVAKLNDQLLMHKAELESVKQESKEVAVAVPLKAMAAAAAASAIGFYDYKEGHAPEPTQVVASDHVREFEKRIEELRNSDTSKDEEIAKLRDRLAELEATPDPDARRQILFTAKNAEVTQLRGVLNSLFQPVSQEEIAVRAYNYAKDRSFRGGSPTEDWLRAERDAHYNRLAAAWETTRGGGTMF
jgi:chromosome segregation ATPase